MSQPEPSCHTAGPFIRSGPLRGGIGWPAHNPLAHGQILRQQRHRRAVWDSAGESHAIESSDSQPPALAPRTLRGRLRLRQKHPSAFLWVSEAVDVAEKMVCTANSLAGSSPTSAALPTIDGRHDRRLAGGLSGAQRGP